MRNVSPTTPLGFMLLMLAVQNDRRGERGASAVEWIIIAAIVVGICGAVALVLKPALEGEAGEIANEIQKQ